TSSRSRSPKPSPARSPRPRRCAKPTKPPRRWLRNRDRRQPPRVAPPRHRRPRRAGAGSARHARAPPPAERPGLRRAGRRPLAAARDRGDRCHDRLPDGARPLVEPHRPQPRRPAGRRELHRPGQLRQAVRLAGVPERVAGDRGVQPRRAGAGDADRPGAGAAAQPGHPRPGAGALGADQHHDALAGGGRHGVAPAAQPGAGRLQRPALPARPAGAGVAVLVQRRPARTDHGGRVALDAADHADPARRPPGGADRHVRGGPDRRGERLEHVPPHHAADAQTLHRDRPADPVYGRGTHLRRHLRDDRWRPGQRQREPQRHRLLRRVPDLRHRVLLGDLGGDLRHHGAGQRADHARVRPQDVEFAMTPNARRSRAKARRRWSHSALTLLMLVIGVVWVAPTIWVVWASVRPTGTGAPAVTLRYFRAVFTDYGFLPNLLNSITTTTISTLLGLVIGTPAAYALARIPFRRKERITFWLLTTRMAPPMLIALPLFIVARQFGFYDTVWLLILIYTAVNLSWVVFMMRSYFSDIPAELDEAAAVD